jgi:TfoX/Sxy family transcriptional regulator of competence genes
MVYSKSLAARIRQTLARQGGIVEKKMFGGVAFLMHGNMCVGVWQDMLIARLGPQRANQALLTAHVKAFDVTGRPMTGWVMVEPEGIDLDDELHAWINDSIGFVATLPRK